MMPPMPGPPERPAGGGALGAPRPVPVDEAATGVGVGLAALAEAADAPAADETPDGAGL